MNIRELKKLIEKTLDQNKAKDIIAINLKGKSSIADYMIIASGNSSRHIQSLSEMLLRKLQEEGVNQCKIEGKTSDEWKLIDAIFDYLLKSPKNFLLSMFLYFFL